MAIIRNEKSQTTVRLMTEFTSSQMSIENVFSHHDTIQHSLETLAEDPVSLKKASQLVFAIQQGDHEAAIFTDPHCYLYLLHLIKTKAISLEQGTTVYFYLMALMQFTFQHATFSLLKNIREIKIANLSQNESLTEEGRRYLGELAKDNDFCATIAKLPRSEQWLIKIPVTSSSQFSFDALVNKYRCRVPFFKVCRDGEIDYLCVPSQTIIRHFFKKCHLPLALVPKFGLVDPATLQSYHRNNQQPIALFDPHAKKIDYSSQYICSLYHANYGPFGRAINHCAQAYMGSQLSYQFRMTLQVYLLPFLDSLMQTCDLYSDDKTFIMLKRIVAAFNDFYYISHFSQEEATFLKFVLNSPIFYAGPSAIGERVYDTILFLIHRIDLTKLEWEEKAVNLLKNFITFLEEIVDSHRAHPNGIKISSIIKILAQQENTATISSLPNIDWQAWADLLATTDNKNLWDKACAERHDELVILINHRLLKLYPPYLPFTAEKRLAFQHCIDEQIANMKKANVPSETIKPSR